jgi:hypothetical protein
LLRSSSKRTVARTVITTDRGRVEVSTVFLVLDHSLGDGDGPPVLWESMTFGGLDDMACRRYTSRAAALVGHDDMVTVCRFALGLSDTKIIAEERVG